MSSVKKSIRLFLISVVIFLQGLFEVISLYCVYLVFNYLLSPDENLNTNFFYNTIEKLNLVDIGENNYLQYLIIFVLIIYVLKLLFAILTFFTIFIR